MFVNSYPSALNYARHKIETFNNYISVKFNADIYLFGMLLISAIVTSLFVFYKDALFDALIPF
jgi:hypothetical protein